MLSKLTRWFVYDSLAGVFTTAEAQVIALAPGYHLMNGVAGDIAVIASE